jgi:hypothetical protein
LVRIIYVLFTLAGYCESVDETQLFSFLLRVWRAGDGKQPNWRASVEDIRTGERRGFDSLEELFAFILKLPVDI